MYTSLVLCSSEVVRTQGSVVQIFSWSQTPPNRITATGPPSAPSQRPGAQLNTSPCTQMPLNHSCLPFRILMVAWRQGLGQVPAVSLALAVADRLEKIALSCV